MAKNREFDLTTVKGRLLQFLKVRRISQSEFGRILGVAPTYVGAMRRSLSADKVAKLTRAFPDLNRDWLLYGEGKMLKEAESSSGRPDDAKVMTVPLLPVAAFAGDIQGWSQSVDLRDCERVTTPIPGADFAIRISGDSMEPLIHDGSTLLIKKINERAFIPWGSTMVIDSENGVLIKDVYPSGDDPKYIEARSRNPRYPPIRIPTSSVFGLYRVMGAIQLFSSL